MTSGKRVKRAVKASLLIALNLGVLYARNNSVKKLKAKEADPTIAQYVNRLIEFFDEEHLDRAVDEFLTMVDFGVYPHEAFSILVFSGELN